MSLTLNTKPNNIDNNGSFNISTDLSEDASHINLRVRAEITYSATIVAVVEKPKGINTFNFSDILESLVPGFTLPRALGYYLLIGNGSPLAAYTILFTEIYEDSSGVTQSGDTENASGVTFRYVPAVGDGTAFSNYILHDTSSLFANKTLRNGITKFYTDVPYELRILFFTEVPHIDLYWSKDGAAYNSITNITCSDGWGALILNKSSGGLMENVSSNLRVQLGEYDTGGAKISEVITILVDSSQIDERVVLEYDGIVGGKEYLAFEGIKDISFTTIRNYYKNTGQVNKLISVAGVNKQTLETRFKDINNAEYLKSLLMSSNVVRMEAAYAEPTPVTVTTTEVTIDKGRELFTNQIDIEYEN